ncbi:MAG: zinc ribbon domain-containing protein [Clostridia bacterium]|nr:zinc ribbon domain-containing protein [Clostridia bacterium]
MYKRCPYCGTINADTNKFCISCATPLHQVQPDPRIVAPMMGGRPMQGNVQMQGAQQKNNVKGKKKKGDKKSKKKRSAASENLSPEQKKKRRIKKILTPIISIVVVVAVVAFAWFAVGNQITLSIHTDKDVDTMNSGRLEMPGAYYSQYSDMPDYVVKLLGGDPQSPDYGPVMTEVMPYVRVERNKVNGFFGGNTVEYTIYAPDLESWLLNLGNSKKYTQDSLLEELKAYLPNAPLRSQVVTIEYAHDGIFSWQGNYMCIEFSNAISGGINTAYSELYAAYTEELEANIK